MVTPTWFLDAKEKASLIVDYPNRGCDIDIKRTPFLVFEDTNGVRFKESRLRCGEWLPSNIAEWADDYLLFLNGIGRGQERLRFTLDSYQSAEIVSLDELPPDIVSVWKRDYCRAGTRK